MNNGPESFFVDDSDDGKENVYVQVQTALPSPTIEKYSRTNHLSIATAASLAISLALNHIDEGSQVILSDFLCWALLWIALEAYLWTRRSSEPQAAASEDSSRILPTVIALAAVVASFASSFCDVRWVAPALTPALLLFRSNGSKWLPVSSDANLLPFSKGASPIQRYSVSVLVSVSIAVFSTVFLSALATKDSIAPGILAFAAQFVLYAALQHTSTGSRLPGGRYDASSDRAMLMRAVILLAVGSWIRFGTGDPEPVFLGRLLLAGFLKTAQWGFLLYMVTATPWDIVTTVATFGIGSAATPYADLSTFYACGQALAGLVALAQTYLYLPKYAGGRWMLSLFVLSPLLALSVMNADVRDMLSWEQMPTRHPITILAQQHSQKFQAMLGQQSRTLAAAVEEYQIRYKRSPPPGFDAWFEYATKHNSAIIDDFDIINESLAPFWNVSPAQLRAYIAEAVNGSDSLMLVSLNQVSMEAQGNDWSIKSILRLLSDSEIKDLPQFDLAFNTLPEPRVLLSSSIFPGPAEHTLEEIQWWANAGNGSSLRAYLAQTCPAATSSESLLAHYHHSAKHIYTFKLPFIQDDGRTTDLCTDRSQQHGFLEALPVAVARSPVPVFSPGGAPRPFADVLLPNPAHRALIDDAAVYDELTDLPWKRKLPVLHWAGATTLERRVGGVPFERDLAHRRRFVARFAAGALREADESVTFLTEAAAGRWEAYRSVDPLRHLFDIRVEREAEGFAGGEGLSVQDSRALKRQMDQALGCRFVFDTDGEGASSRFYALLRSRSAVLKQTVFREWHDDRLVPWVHYVPVSLELDEVPEVMRYLALTEEGDALAQSIAEAGREWQMRALRKEDEVVYLYRLFLEYARLVSDERESMGFVVGGEASGTGA